MTPKCYVYMFLEVLGIISFKLGERPFDVVSMVGDFVWNSVLSEDERDLLNRRTM